jgi:rhodanese-related sulfurtransferase
VITELIDYDQFCGVPGGEHVGDRQADRQEIGPPELVECLQGSTPPQVIDVREPHELDIACLPGAVNIPLGQLASRLSELDSAQEYVVMCRSGVRSAQALDLLTSAGFRRVKNLRGGINAWAREVDPSLRVY